MAAHAVGSDVSLTFGCIPNNDVLQMIGSAVGDIFYLLVKELGEVAALLVRQLREGRHALLRTPRFEKRCEVLTVVVTKHKIGCDETGSRSPTRLRTVAKGTILLIDRGRTASGRLIRLRPQAEKGARGSSTLVGWILIGHSSLRRASIGGRHLLPDCRDSKKSETRRQSHYGHSMAHR